jgi:hypothetical protein
MVDNIKIMECFQGLVGWRNSDNSCYDTIPSGNPLRRSDSGLVFNDLDELVSIETVSAIKGEKTTLVNYLTRITNDSILKLINSFMLQMSVQNNGKTLLENKTILNGVASVAQKINKRGRFVGYEFRLKSFNNLAVLMRRLSMQVDTVQPAPLAIFVYEAGSYEPVTTQEITPNVANSAQWFDLTDLILSYNGTNGGRVYYIGYYEDDLTGNALRKDFYEYGCNCAADPYPYYSPYMHIRSFSLPADFIDADRKLFNIERLEYESQNWGLNFEPLVYCDLSTILCQNKLLFAQALQYMVGARVMQGIISTNEINLITERSKADAYALMKEYQARLVGGKDANGNYYGGEMKKLNIDFSGLDKVCLPNKPSAISIGTNRR